MIRRYVLGRGIPSSIANSHLRESDEGARRLLPFLEEFMYADVT